MFIEINYGIIQFFIINFSRILLARSLIVKKFCFILLLWSCHAHSFTHGIKCFKKFLLHSNMLKKLAWRIDDWIIRNWRFFILWFILCIFKFTNINTYMNTFRFALVRKTCTDDNPFGLFILHITDMKSALVHVDPSWFALVRRTDIQIRNILRTHLRIIHFCVLVIFILTGPTRMLNLTIQSEICLDI